jgi:hypothetical protein
MKIHTDRKEAAPLSWPEGWQRTRPQDQRLMPAWKKTANQYRDALLVELSRMHCPSAVISTNVPLTVRNQMTPGVEPRDVGVAVYFSRRGKDDFSWQEVLGISEPVAATEAQVQEAFKRLAAIHHPDRGGDLAMFQQIATARDNAIRWINRASEQNFSYVIACDQFQQVRLNLAAIMLTLRAIRQIERCGTSSLLERAFKGFSALPEYAGAAAVGAAQ